MTNNARRLFLRRKWVLAAVALPVLIALWWAFRPEKLWSNQKVNEAAPFDASGEPQPILTGRIKAKRSRPAAVRRSIRSRAEREFLRISDFSPPDSSDIDVLLARSDDAILAQEAGGGQLQGIDCGPLKSNQGDQDYDLPMASDLKKYEAVVIYAETSHTVFGTAKLEPF